jgi:hypothetical protein
MPGSPGSQVYNSHCLSPSSSAFENTVLPDIRSFDWHPHECKFNSTSVFQRRTHSIAYYPSTTNRVRKLAGQASTNVPRHGRTPNHRGYGLTKARFNDGPPRHERETNAIVQHGKSPAGEGQ